MKGNQLLAFISNIFFKSFFYFKKTFFSQFTYQFQFPIPPLLPLLPPSPHPLPYLLLSDSGNQQSLTHCFAAEPNPSLLCVDLPRCPTKYNGFQEDSQYKQ